MRAMMPKKLKSGTRWHKPEFFDSSAVYYQHDAGDGTMNEAPWHDVGSYDQAFAAYLDARKRFSDLRLARGFLPIVAYFSRFQPNVKGQEGEVKRQFKRWFSKGSRRPTSTALLP